MDKIKNTAFFRGAALLSVSVVITKIIGVAFKVPLSYVLGDSGMGYFNTAYAIYGFFYILCTAGVPKSITLILTGHGIDCADENERIFVLKCALRMFLTIGIFVTLFNIICAPATANLIGNKKACFSILSIAPSLLFVSMSGALRGYLNSAERLSEIALSQLLEGVIKLVFGLSLAYLGVRISAPISVISALAISGITLGSVASFLYLLIKTFYSNKAYNTKQKCKINLREIRRKILKNALPIALCASLLNLSSTLDLIIIIKRLVQSGSSEMYANSMYGNYTTLAVPMFMLVISVLSPFATSYMPRLSSVYVKGDRASLVSELNNLFGLTILIAVPASLAFFFYSFDMLDVLFSVQSSAIGADMLICLSFGICLLSALTVINTALESCDRIAVTVFSLLVGAVTKIGVSYALIGRAGIGILGAPIGTVVSYAASLFISIFALELCGIRLHTLGKLITLYILGVVCFYPPYALIYSRGVIENSFACMIASVAVSCVLYALGVLVLHILYSCAKMFNLHKKTL